MSLTLQLGIRHITVEKLQAGSEFVTIFGKILYNANIDTNVLEKFAHFLNFKNRNF
jgi:hypothetical protein